MGVPLIVVAFLYLFSSPVYENIPFVYQHEANGDSTIRTLPESLYLVQLNGDTLTTEDLRGNILVMNFFSARDDSAKKRTVLHGNLKRIYDNLNWEDKPALLFLSVSTGDSLPDLKAYDGQREAVDPAHWPIVYTDPEMLYALGVSLGIPRMVAGGVGMQAYTDFNIALIDKQSRLRSYFVGTNLQQERKIQETLVGLWRLEYADEIGSNPLRTLEP